MRGDIHVMLVSDGKARREELEIFLREQTGFIISVVRDTDETKQLLLQEQPDVVLLSVELVPPFYESLGLVMALLKFRPTKMILLASLEEREAILDAFTIGVLNIVDKSNYKDVPAAIRDAHQNRASLHPDVAELLREEVSRLRQLELQCLLTPAEKQVLDLLLQDYTKKQIAEALNVTMNTVKFHLRSLIRKIGGKTGKEAAEIAKRRGYK